MLGDDESAIRRVAEDWLAAGRAGDIEALSDLLTEDVIFMVPGREPFGKEDIVRSLLANKNMRKQAKIDFEELQVLGDWAYIRNYVEIRVTSGEAVRGTGYALAILRKETGNWRLARVANLLTWSDDVRESG
jgi:uncharacterized protein (TIGR02246 family)